MKTRDDDIPPVPDDYGVLHPVLDSDPLWFATKNRTYRDNLTTLLVSLHEFLASNDLYTDPDRAFPGPEKFRLYRDALTDKGLKFVWRYLDGYLEQYQPAAIEKYLKACLRRLDNE